MTLNRPKRLIGVFEAHSKRDGKLKLFLGTRINGAAAVTFKSA